MPDTGIPLYRARRRAAPARVAARLLLVAMSWFIVYGSLFPFDFAASPRPLSSFIDEARLFANRSDAIDNFLLFVPFGLALQASFAGLRARVSGAVLALLVLGVGIQLIQLYLPSRTASLSDVIWNSIGMAAGMLAAARAGDWLTTRMRVLAAPHEAHDNFLLGLVAVWVCYESFPLLPTLDLGMLRAHVRPAFIAPPFGLSRLLQHGAAAAVAAVALMHAGWLCRPLRGLVLLGGLALALEVWVPYGALRRETLLGIVLGLASGAGLARSSAMRAALMAMALSLAMLLFTVLTPYRGQFRGDDFSLIPFSQFFRYSSLGVVPPLAFETLALGALLWSGLRLGRGPALSWCVFVFLLAGLLEMLRAAAGYHGDTTLLLLVLVLAPCAAALRVRTPVR